MSSACGSETPLSRRREDRTGWEYPYAIRLPFDCPAPADFRVKLETGVKNGDCLPACMAAALEAMHKGFVEYRNMKPIAAEMRADLVSWIKRNWTAYPVFNPSMQVNEIMQLQHDAGITPSERETHGGWGASVQDRLSAYTRVCERIYFSDAEMLMFASWLFETHEIPVMFRVYRCTGAHGANGQHISNTPDPELLRSMGIEEAVILEMDHNGRVDGASAHYKLLEGGSLAGLTEVKHTERRPRRLVKTADMQASKKRSFVDMTRDDDALE